MLRNKDLSVQLFLELFEGIYIFFWSLKSFPYFKGHQISRFFIFSLVIFCWVTSSIGIGVFFSRNSIACTSSKNKAKSHFVSNWFVGLDKIKFVNRPKILLNATRPNFRGLRSLILVLSCKLRSGGEKDSWPRVLEDFGLKETKSSFFTPDRESQFRNLDN